MSPIFEVGHICCSFFWLSFSAKPGCTARLSEKVALWFYMHSLTNMGNGRIGSLALKHVEFADRLIDRGFRATAKMHTIMILSSLTDRADVIPLKGSCMCSSFLLVLNVNVFLGSFRITLKIKSYKYPLFSNLCPSWYNFAFNISSEQIFRTWDVNDQSRFCLHLRIAKLKKWVYWPVHQVFLIRAEYKLSVFCLREFHIHKAKQNFLFHSRKETRCILIFFYTYTLVFPSSYIGLSIWRNYLLIHGKRVILP